MLVHILKIVLQEIHENLTSKYAYRRTILPVVL
jgi:hypothetical protein